MTFFEGFSVFWTLGLILAILHNIWVYSTGWLGWGANRRGKKMSVWDATHMVLWNNNFPLLIYMMGPIYFLLLFADWVNYLRNK